MRRGFTLIELLVVIAIVGIIAALAVPAYRHSTQAAATATCISNLRQIGVALTGYLADHDMQMPVLKALRENNSEDVPVIDNTLNAYTQTTKIFACPADTRNFAGTTGTSYYWNTALNGQPLAGLNFLKLIEDHSRIPILADKEGFHPYEREKVNLLYADGHATKDLSFFTSK